MFLFRDLTLHLRSCSPPRTTSQMFSLISTIASPFKQLLSPEPLKNKKESPTRNPIKVLLVAVGSEFAFANE